MIANIKAVIRKTLVMALSIFIFVFCYSGHGDISVAAQEIKPIDVYQDPHGIDLTTNNVSTSKMPTLSISGSSRIDLP